MDNFHLEFILNTYNVSLQTVKNSLVEFCDKLEIIELRQDNPAKDKNYKISLYAQEPTVIFDLCSQFGRITSAKVDEVKD